MRSGTGYEEDLAMQQMDPDVEDLIKKEDEDAAKRDEKNANKSTGNVTGNDAQAKTSVKSTDDDDDIPSAIPAAVAVEDTKEMDSNSTNSGKTVGFNVTHPLSAKFNQTFYVEANDHVQADELLSPELKQFLVDHPHFFIDFQEDQFMVYREYTMEPEEYSLALELGKRVLGHLPANLTPGKMGKASSDAAHDMKSFVSKNEVSLVTN